MRMDKSTALGMGIILFGCVAAYAESPLSFEVTADYMSKYIWRGQDFTDEPVLQPGASVTYENLTLGIWGNLETTDVSGNSGAFTELDYYVDYSASVPGLENLGYSVGYIYYDFPEVPATLPGVTEEVYVGLSYDTFLSPSATVYFDIDEADGYYVSLGIEHTVENVIGEIGADLSASLGYGDKDYNNYYWVVPSSKVNDLVVGVGFPFEVGKVSVTPSVTYIALLDNAIKATNMYNVDNNYVVVGVGASLAF